MGSTLPLNARRQHYSRWVTHKSELFGKPSDTWKALAPPQNPKPSILESAYSHFRGTTFHCWITPSAARWNALRKIKWCVRVVCIDGQFRLVHLLHSVQLQKLIGLQSSKCGTPSKQTATEETEKTSEGKNREIHPPQTLTQRRNARLERGNGERKTNR